MRGCLLTRFSGERVSPAKGPNPDYGCDATKLGLGRSSRRAPLHHGDVLRSRRFDRHCAKLDAEEWRDLVGAYLDAASAAVTAMGRHVAKTLGDGLMALFGYPVAQENDAERAARAALAIQRALAELNRRRDRSDRSAARAVAPGSDPRRHRRACCIRPHPPRGWLRVSGSLPWLPLHKRKE
jgi:class 3 adenylate cyclase